MHITTISSKFIISKSSMPRGPDKKPRKKRKEVTPETKALRARLKAEKKAAIAKLKAQDVDVKAALAAAAIAPRNMKGQGKKKIRNPNQLETLKVLTGELIDPLNPIPPMPEFKERKKGKTFKKRKVTRKPRVPILSLDEEFKDMTGVAPKRKPREKIRSSTPRRSPSSRRSRSRLRSASYPRDDFGVAPMDIVEDLPPPPPRKPTAHTRSKMIEKKVEDAKQSIDDVIEAQSEDGKQLLDKIDEVKKGVADKTQRLKECDKLLTQCESHRVKEKKLAEEAKQKTLAALTAIETQFTTLSEEYKKSNENWEKEFEKKKQQYKETFMARNNEWKALHKQNEQKMEDWARADHANLVLEHEKLSACEEEKDILTDKLGECEDEKANLKERNDQLTDKNKQLNTKVENIEFRENREKAVARQLRKLH